MSTSAKAQTRFTNLEQSVADLTERERLAKEKHDLERKALESERAALDLIRSPLGRMLQDLTALGQIRTRILDAIAEQQSYRAKLTAEVRKFARKDNPIDCQFAYLLMLNAPVPLFSDQAIVLLKDELAAVEVEAKELEARIAAHKAAHGLT